ncbi:MAG: DUF4058 family protein, partial [Gemmataceae bacterium]
RSVLMPSPFPGMDPYLEDPAYWSGFHTRFIVALGAAITRQLPGGYYAEIEHHVWLENLETSEQHAFAVPDSYIAEDSPPLRSRSTLLGNTATAEPTAVITLPRSQRPGPRYLQILDRNNHRVITVLELLSPANKVLGPDRMAYISKRNEYLESGTHLVELDLLRAGNRLPWGLTAPPDADFYVLIAQADQFPRASVWGVLLQEPLPIVPVPLKPTDGSVALSLQACFERAYDDGGYAQRINYEAPPYFMVRANDQEWLDERLRRFFLPTPPDGIL